MARLNALATFGVFGLMLLTTMASLTDYLHKVGGNGQAQRRRRGALARDAPRLARVAGRETPARAHSGPVRPPGRRDRPQRARAEAPFSFLARWRAVYAGRLLACMTPLLGPTTGPRLCMGRAYGVARGCCGGGSGRAADGVLDQVCGNDYRSCRHVVPCGAALRVSCGCSCRSACRRSSISCHDALALLTPRACLPAAAAPPPTAVAGGIALSSGR